MAFGQDAISQSHWACASLNNSRVALFGLQSQQLQRERIKYYTKKELPRSVWSQWALDQF
jgi:hypothetical protein